MTQPIEQVFNQVFGKDTTISILKSRIDDTYLVNITGKHVLVARCAGIPQVFRSDQYDEMLRRASTIGYGFIVTE
jgi:hypothetical protein